MHRLRLFQWLAVGLFLVGMAGTAGAVIPQRIAQSVDNSELESLRDNVHPRARVATDLGAVAPDMALTDMTLRFTMTDAQSAALAQLLADQQNPASPRYHQWLTPEQFAAQFGLSAADLAKVTGWLTGQGFAVTQVSRGGTFVRFSGTAAQVASAFHTEIHQVNFNGEKHFANLTAPELPRAIAGVTGGITGLHDFHPKPHHRHSVVAAETVDGQGVVPRFTSSTSGNHFVAPGDFYAIYGESGLFLSGINGSGVTIAVVGQTDVNLADMAAFRSVSGLSVNPPTIKLYGTDPGTASTDDVTEADLDLEWAGATAPGASILYVNGKDVIDGSLTQAIDNNVAPIVSISYGTCESSVGSSLLNYYSTLLQMANAQGQTVVSAAGDSGATDCDYNVTSATQGLAVDFPAAMPYVTGVGGTMFSEGTGTYWGATNGTYQASVTSYIPEAVWNEDSSAGLSSGGGGASAYFTKPAWQVGTGVPADSARDVPDVSLNASAGHDGYLICSTGYCTNGYRNATGYLDVVGGTSAGAPSFSGLLALVVQKTGSRLGNVNPQIYALANSTYYGSVFHDVVTGTNASPCTVGSTDCPAGGTIGYAAGVGYDQATGWGSVNALNLVTDWALVTPAAGTAGLTASATSLALSTASVTQGTSVTLTATVASASSTVSSTPTGTVQFTVDGTNVGSAVTVSAGTATYTLATASLSSGNHTVRAAYQGDVTFAGSIGSANLNVTAASAPDFTLTPATAAVTAIHGRAAPGVTFTVTGLNGFTGNVTFTAVTSASVNAEYVFTVNPVALSSSATTGATVLNLYAYTQANSGLTALTAKAETPAKRVAPWTAAGSGVALAGMMMLVLPRRRKLAGLLVGLLMAGTVFVSGCGSGGVVSSSGTSSSAITATTPGTYTVRVAATGVANGTTVTHTANVTFTVQ